MDLIPVDPNNPVSLEVKEIDKEFEEAQTNIRDLIERGFETLDSLKNILDGSDHPQAALVLAQTLKTIADLNKDLLALRRSKLDMTASVTGKTEGGEQTKIENQQNNIYVGSSNDLQQLLKGRMING